MHGMNSVEQRNPDFWWGGSDRFRGPVKEDVPRYLKGPTPTERRMLDTVEWTIRRYGIDRNRVYLAGNSMGGQGALAIGLPHGEVFAVYKPTFNTWGGYAGDVKSAEMKVAEGANASGQINAFFRWKALADEARGVAMELWIESPEALGTKQFAVPETATADVTLRRVSVHRPAPDRRYAWAFGAQKGTVQVGPDGLLTIPGLQLSRTHTRLLVQPAK